MAAKLKTGDQVVVIAGRDKGARGAIKSVDPKRRRAIVTNVAMAIRHEKATEGQEGRRNSIETPIDLSNLMMVDPETNTPTRVGFRLEDGKKVRFAKNSGSLING